jgi:small-conductance mechanosensitive channel
MRLTGRQVTSVVLLGLGLILAAIPAAASPPIPGWPKTHTAQADSLAATAQQEEVETQEPTREEAVEFSLEQIVTRMVSEAEQAAQTMIQRFDFALSGFQGAGREITLAVERMTGGEGGGRLLAAMALASVPFLLGFATELAYARRLRSVTRWLTGPANVPLLVLPRVLGLGVLHLSRIVLFMLAALAMVVLILPDGGLSRQLALYYALPVFRLRIVLLAVWLLLMPSKPSLRPLPCSQPFARHLFLWISAFLGVTVFAYNFIRLLRMHGLSEQLHLLLTIFEMCFSLSILFVLVWTSPRPAVSGEARRPDAAGLPAAKPRSLRDWRLSATAFLCVMLLAYVASVLLGRHAFRWDLLLSLATIPAFIAADTAMRSTIQAALAEKTAAGTEGLALLSIHAVHLMSGFRVLLAVAWVFLLLWIWGVRFSFEAAISRMVFSIVGTAVLGWFIWEWVRSAIDRRLTDETREEGEESEDVEEMGTGGSRKTTLLTLARKFILGVILVATALILLSALGIDVGPLLAGAGIAGLAIGFGAQTLVKDILSGVFFLLDDAFRLGEYIEADSSKGTVVHISVRSLKLRHPRGKLLTIPYGSLGAITNYSRDWAIMKLDLRVPYDTDLEKVRKIMKKLGQRLADDPELGPKFLAPVKSQGVREIDDSAMILRVKFKSRPHDQFILRREVFKHIQHEFAKNDIEFAPRKVTIHIPESYRGAAGKDLDMGIMAAAAESALEQKPAPDEKSKDKKS